MKNIITTAIVLLFASASILAQQIIYVKADVQGSGSGLSWANAMPNLQPALGQATYGTEIRIAAGTYRPTNGINRDSTFYLKNGVRLRGGFAGEGPNPDLQNPDVYATIFSGDVGMLGDSSDNSYSVMTSSGDMDETTLLEGLIIEEGAATSNNPNDLSFSHRKSGGGLYIKTGSINRLKAENCVFRRNRAVSNGAHIFVLQQNGQSNFRVENCQFLDGIGGSGLWFVGNSTDSIFISHCAFLRHRSLPGEPSIVLGITPYNKIKKVILEYSQFKDCEVGDLLGSNTLMAGIGGDTAVMKNCMFYNNVHSGGDLFSIGGTRANFLDQDTFLSNKNVNNLGNLLSSSGSFLFSSLKQQIRNCIFEQNEETHLFRSFYSANISQCAFRDNILGRALFLDQITAEYAKLTTVENSIFDRNTYQTLIAFETVQGNIYPVDNKAWTFNQNLFQGNTGLFFDARRHNITNHTSTATWNYCTFSDNHFPNGHSGDTLSYLFHLRNIDFATFNSCVFDQPLQDSMRLFYDSLCYLQLKNNVFGANSCSQTYQFGNDAHCDTSNFWGVSPLFVDKAAGDYRLEGCSPGINKGDVQLLTQLGLSADLNDGNRIENGLPDIGAFENKLFLQGYIAQYSCHSPATGAFDFAGNTCGPYATEWWNGAESGESVTDLPVGQYAFTVTDAHGIAYLDTLLMPAFVAVSIDSLLLSPSNLTAQDGNIEVSNIQNGVPPYQLAWSTGDSTLSISGLSAGSYILTITDSLGCKVIFRFELKAPIVGIPNVDGDSHYIYVQPNVIDKESPSRLSSKGDFSEIMIIDAIGRVVFHVSHQGKIYDLPPIRNSGIFWVFAKNNESGRWMRPVPLRVF